MKTVDKTGNGVRHRISRVLTRFVTEFPLCCLRGRCDVTLTLIHTPATINYYYSKSNKKRGCDTYKSDFHVLYYLV